jgi:hypothetical protein
MKPSPFRTFLVHEATRFTQQAVACWSRTRDQVYRCSYSCTVSTFAEIVCF